MRRAVNRLSSDTAPLASNVTRAAPNEPASPDTYRRFSALGFLVTILTVPPRLSPPSRIASGPFSTSNRSILAMGWVLPAAKLLLDEVGIPLTAPPDEKPRTV